jgi:hypothetical protein
VLLLLVAYDLPHLLLTLYRALDGFAGGQVLALVRLL